MHHFMKAIMDMGFSKKKETKVNRYICSLGIYRNRFSMIDNSIAWISNSFPPMKKCIFLGLRF